MDERTRPADWEGGIGVRIPAGPVTLDGDLVVPPGATGTVIFVHGSGSSRHSPRNRQVARRVGDLGFGTLLFDLLTGAEEVDDEVDGHLRFDISLLAWRLRAVTLWAVEQFRGRTMGLGYFGASTGAAAALVCAAHLGPAVVAAVVSRGGRPDLAGPSLGEVASPTLLIVGGNDPVVLELNRVAYSQLQCARELAVVDGSTHLFEEPGALERVAALAGSWYQSHLGAR